MKMLKRGLLRKLVVSYSFIFLAIVLVIVIAAYRYITDISQKTAEINQIQLTDKLVNQLEDYLNEMNKLARQIKADSRIINTFNMLQTEQEAGNYFEKDVLENIDTGSILTSHNGPGAPIWRISVYNQYGDYISSGAPISPRNRIRENLSYAAVNALMNGFMERVNTPLMLPPQIDRWSDVYDEKYISLMLPITDYYGTEIYGIVEIQQPVGKLEERIALDMLPDLRFYLFDEDGRQILPEVPMFANVENQGYSITRRSAPGYDWTAALVQSRASMLRPYRSILLYMLLGGGALAVVMTVVVFIISKRISKPLVNLSNKVREMSIDSVPENWTETDSTDEVRELGNAFSGLLKRLTDSIELEKKAYLQSLQSQMDPHFLFNSLTILSSMGIEVGSDKIVNTCAKISDLMRYSTDHHLSTLGKEVESLSNYLDLMKLRYEEYFSYSIDVSPSLYSVPIIRLVLQPIVENCFEHGFKPVAPPWRIDISGRLTEGGWEMRITDNGAGIDHEKRLALDERVFGYLQDLPENYAELKIGGMGLVNTILRLKLFNGAKCFIENVEPRGTLFRIVGNGKELEGNGRQNDKINAGRG